MMILELHKKMKFPIKDFFSKSRFTGEILKRKVHFSALLLHIFQLYMIFQDVGKAVYGAVV